MSTSPRSLDVKRDWGHDETGCTVLHVDMDAFFASCEIARHSELAGRPVIVGTGTRAVVSTASYEARRFGVHSAQPIATARRICPQGVFLPVDHTYYSSMSRRILSVLRSVTDRVEQVSIDEAFLDVSTALLRWKRPTVIGAWLRREISARFHVTCSVGVASNMLIAKIASTNAKPDGLLFVPRARQAEFIQMLSLRSLPGVGPSTARSFERWGVVNVAQLARLPERDILKIVHSASVAHTLFLAARGESSRQVTPCSPEKSISAERTFTRDTSDRGCIRKLLCRCSDEIATRLRAHDLVARTVTLKLRFANLRYATRSSTSRLPFDSAGAIRDLFYPVLDDLLVRYADSVRLAGLSVSRLSHRAVTTIQPELEWDAAPETAMDSKQSATMSPVAKAMPKTEATSAIESSAPRTSHSCIAAQEKAERALDNIRSKYGQRSVRLGFYDFEPRDSRDE
ncbi:MAG: DNA polymerase IV [Aeriscardovia sp.]|nr:DNA polymerase IV [Aeriscardovia sp.]